MSAVTLETLRADFFDCPYHAGDNHVILEEALNESWNSGWQAALSSSAFVGFIYLIARDYGLEAAMLYKLSDGGIDPRNEVQP